MLNKIFSIRNELIGIVTIFLTIYFAWYFQIHPISHQYDKCSAALNISRDSTELLGINLTYLKKVLINVKNIENRLLDTLNNRGREIVILSERKRNILEKIINMKMNKQQYADNLKVLESINERLDSIYMVKQKEIIISSPIEFDPEKSDSIKRSWKQKIKILEDFKN